MMVVSHANGLSSRELLFSLASTIIVLLSTAANAENAAIRRAIEGYVIPAYAEFHAAAEASRSAMQQLCAEPGPGGLERARKSFGVMAVAWSQAEIIRFGPITAENRLERILFWPDRKSTGLKQVQAALANEDPTASDPIQLTRKSVAMQGLGALEFVLFGTGFEELEAGQKPYRCEYGRAIATNIEHIAGEAQAGWLDPQGIASRWADPRPGNTLYRSDDEAMTEVLNVLIHGLELVRDVRIDGFLGETAENDKPKQAIYWRSDNTFRSIGANLRGLKRLFDAVDFKQLLATDSNWIPESIDFEFGNADRALAGLAGTPVTALAEPGKRQAFGYAKLVTSSLSDIFGTRLAHALGLTAGFSSLDGD